MCIQSRILPKLYNQWGREEGDEVNAAPVKCCVQQALVFGAPVWRCSTSIAPAYMTSGEKFLEFWKSLLLLWWYVYTMEYYSAIYMNESESVAVMWMKLEPIKQSEVSQKEKSKYHILMHICGI